MHVAGIRGGTLAFVRADDSAPARSADTRLRGALLMPVCALAVHQLRYYLAFGVHAHARLTRDGHAYLGTIEPLVLVAAALAAGLLLGECARAWQRRRHRGPGARRRAAAASRIWAACAVALLADLLRPGADRGRVRGRPPGRTGRDRRPRRMDRRAGRDRDRGRTRSDPADRRGARGARRGRPPRSAAPDRRNRPSTDTAPARLAPRATRRRGRRPRTSGPARSRSDTPPYPSVADPRRLRAR